MPNHERNGRSTKYVGLKCSYEAKIKTEAQKYTDKIENDVQNGDRNSSYAALRKLGVRPGKNKESIFTLPGHVESNLSAQQSTKIIANHFAAISQLYDIISVSNFPQKMRQAFANPDMSAVPDLEEYEVFEKIRKSKKPNSSVPGDLPKKLVQEFSCELSTPVTTIYNSILRKFEYPRQWVIEHQIPLPKCYPPSSEDALRNIAKTAFFSKIFESFLSYWLMPIVEPYLDPCQYNNSMASKERPSTITCLNC